MVAAMGDSLIAGNGATEDYALGTFIESRGVSWAIGKFLLPYYMEFYRKSSIVGLFDHF